MKHSLHTLLQGAFYIDASYALSLIPSLSRYFSVEDNNKTEFNENEAKEKATQLNTGNEAVGSKQVAILNIKNPIIKYSDYYYGLGTKAYGDILKSLEASENVAGVVLDIDSGGGQVYGTPEFYDLIKNFSKPIVAYTDGYMCSAAYYIGSATNFIVANKRADHIGSIGAYASFVDGRGFLEKFGAKVHTIYATKSTEKNSEYREILDNSNYEPYIKNQLDPIVETFHQDMKAARPNLNTEVFKGGTWNGKDSLDMNLVDALGNIDTAIAKVFELSHENNQNFNTPMETKERKQLQNVLELDSPLATTENGSYLNEDQLDAVETALADNETALADAQTAQQTAETNLTQEQEKVKGLEASLNQLATVAGIDPGATATDTLTSLQNRIAELNAQPGETHTKVKEKVKEGQGHDYIDFEASIYQQN